jgi:glycerol kinase
VDRPMVQETTALGAAMLAGLAAGILPGLDAIADQWRLDRRFEPHMDDAVRGAKLARWRDAIGRLLNS